MHSAPVFTTFFLAAASLVAAQSVDPNSVPIGTRQQWCNSQLASCPLICSDETDGSLTTTENSCDVTTLSYGCICGNGLQPNASEYSQTLPYFLCTQQNTDCVNNCAASDSACQSACQQDNPCGAQNPTRVNTTSSAATASKTGDSAAASTAAGTAVYTGFGGAAETGSSDSGSSGSSGSSSSSSSSNAAALINFGQLYGLSLVATGLFAGFAMML